MEVRNQLLQSIANDSLLEFLLGSEKYFIESSPFSPEAGQVDTSKIISKGIYKLYLEDEKFKNLFEQSLCEMVVSSDYGLYMSLKYFASLLFKEKNHLSPFEIDKTHLSEVIKSNLAIRENAIKSRGIEVGIIGHIDAWPEIERIRQVIKDEYGIQL
ncbi:hypothetical protein [Streptococcus acidominimus]|uniref:Uncharacterized protein n=1 Tax=Streptococcus acidominimus TaxID=1326 RepID=A0A1Q8EC08_STRAI|nr:hypothetical protein [Streptococcus acidominimus]OLF49343.1 hypothetical protein BU200_07875 [Streptococcus acidominimus]SUN07528.1 Uncharacterised protein [Streptococcus acidominimus]